MSQSTGSEWAPLTATPTESVVVLPDTGAADMVLLEAEAGSAPAALMASPGRSDAETNLTLFATLSEAAVAWLVGGTAKDVWDEAPAVLSMAAPLRADNSSSTSPAQSQPVSTSTDEADTVDEAISDFDTGPLDDALLEDLAVALVG